MNKRQRRASWVLYLSAILIPGYVLLDYMLGIGLAAGMENFILTSILCTSWQLTASWVYRFLAKDVNCIQHQLDPALAQMGL